jgi:hypothetical protein
MYVRSMTDSWQVFWPGQTGLSMMQLLLITVRHFRPDQPDDGLLQYPVWFASGSVVNPVLRLLQLPDSY